ncbi:MAG: transglutaminase-like domain-containing protein [Bacteroidia bacterium]|nr:transglutaminase-like domain-containing protein [Bacteroidia bacterium]
MIFRRLILFLFLLTATVARGQITNDKFEKFAIKQDSLFIVAYEQKDTKTYNKLLTEFLSQYDKLSADGKMNFSGYLSGAYYNLCCTYSLLDNKEMALTYLKKSIDAGYIDYKHIQEDTDLDNIRKEKEFLIINSQLRNVGDFLYILKKADKYNLADNRQLPTFTYQSSDNQNLTSLRKAFNLDSIAGKGTDVLKILNLLHWIHNLIPHDGNHENPVVKNAMSMIAECKRDDRGLNCRGLATVLNECYLSLGIKSRIVTCLPKDSLKIDNDCHVINSVYSETLKKWLWIDPTFNAYVMNEKGEMLSIEEVRERIIQDKPVILNPDANWNNQNPQTTEYYLLNYMAKNLYILECPTNSEYNMETRESGRIYSYIQLLPLDYYQQSPDKTEKKDEKTKTTWTIFKTNNPKLFWQTP